MKLDVFSKMDIEVLRDGDEWIAFRLGAEGKKRRMHDLELPADIAPEELVTYIADVFHEWATPANSNVRVLED